jgi:hypothetical protein
MDHCRWFPRDLTLFLPLSLKSQDKQPSPSTMLRFDQTIFTLVSTVLFLGRISSAMSVSSAASECAVVGCGVLGTSLCKQMIGSPQFSSWKGKKSPLSIAYAVF